MYLTAGHFKFTESGCERAVELMNEIVKIGRGEKGIHQYTFYPNPDSKNAWFLFEEWESKEAHDAHFESAAMQALVPVTLASGLATSGVVPAGSTVRLLG